MAVTTQEIQAWLASNPTADDRTIAAAMQQHGVTPAQMATATGLSPTEVQRRYDAAIAPAPATQTQMTPEQIQQLVMTSMQQMQPQQQASPSTASSASMQTISNWAAPYITDYLSKGQALASMPYEAYTGPLTAGASGLQNQAFQGLAGLAVPGAFGEAAGAAGQAVQGYQGLGAYDPTQFQTGMWNQAAAQQYMNPYLMEALNPQLDEARRQAEISRNADAARLAQAGAYGGSRQAIMESEGQRNLLRNMADITGKGYFDAYNTAMQGFQADQNRALEAQVAGEGSRQFGANYGLAGLAGQLTGAQTLANIGQNQLGAQRNILGDQLAGGEIQRGITSEGIKADYDQFREERAWPYQQLMYQQGLMQGLPFTTTKQYGAVDPLGGLLAGAGGISALFK